MEVLREYIWLAWDVLAIAILVYFVKNCARRGLASTVLSFSGYIVAAIVAKACSTAGANLLYKYVVRDALRVTLTRRLDTAFAAGGEAAKDILTLLPAAFARLVEKSGQAQAVSSAAADAGGVVEALLDTVLRDPLLSMLQGVSFLLIFSLCLLLVRRIARLFTGLYRVPLVGTLNTLLGGVVGVLQGVLVLCICAFAIRAVLAVSGEEWWWLNLHVMDRTYIWRVLVLPGLN